MRIYEIMQSGGPVMWPLLACSVAVLTVIVERTLFWIGIERRRNRALVDEVLTLAETGNWEEVREKTMSSRDHVVRLLVVGIVHRDYDMGRAMEAESPAQK